ncbi:co-chaperone DjlA [Sulfuriflexus mobilis]|uniref:co-chaperone DjlA n=1 Tax=Sulfuriflexus mobilis TaxID=1811807 RepID=UPI000F820B6E|nr:co-chaperone DjlA [Sulfuriflexus mobilis]
MSWWGKVIGGAFGYLLGGPLGALMGAALGHNFDKGLGGMSDADFRPGARERVQGAFFTATFSVMGHVAKADGKVTHDEIAIANAIMAQLSLSTDMQQAARRLFNEGKQAGFPLDDVLEQLRSECHRRDTLLRMFIEIQMHAAYADGVVHPAERQLIEHICEILGFSRQEMEHLEAMVKAQRHTGGRAGQPVGLSAQEAYAVLGVSAKTSDAEVKKAYRRLMSQHHPDKLVSKGLPEEMMQLAKEKTQEIRSAYEVIKESRGMK